MLWRLSGARVVRGALFQAIRISTAAFAVINIAICIKIDVRSGPFRGYIDAVPEILIIPPRDLHEKLLIWKQEPIIPCTAAWGKAPFVNPVLYIPDEPQFIHAVLGVMDR
ncbi:hypothetical protein D3C76_519630 [compost metagenome]|jgi:hypothetical protein|uniref:Uncharacterized protein n=1 Tax=Pseudomonas neuropathica TaxID=2730425 RepID=A0ACC7MZA7_9PSED|nr:MULTISPECIES: hypothetical protein [Pseudomonas]MDD2103331.1 hypothetical protein [Pseudomonas putida]MEB2624983.1 hypothetical protein [Pseudomonas sp. YuFO8]